MMIRSVSAGWLVIGLVTALSVPLVAQHQGSQRYLVDIETGPAYYRVTIRTSPLAPVKSSESFRLVLKLQDYQGLKKTITESLTIEKGSSQGTAEVYFTSLATAWGNSIHNLHIEQDGNNRFDRQRDLLETTLKTGNLNPMGLPGILVASSNIQTGERQRWFGGKRQRQRGPGSVVTGIQPVPNIEQMDNFLQSFQGGTVPMANSFSIYQSYPSLHGMPLRQLPADWIGLCNIEMLIISWPDLVKVCRGNEQQRRALRNWLSVGGTLVVNQCQQDLANANQIIQTLLDSSRGATTNRSLQWKTPSFRIQSIGTYVVDNRNNYYQTGNQMVSTNNVGFNMANEIKNIDSLAKQQLAVASFINGHVIAVDDNMSNWSIARWQTLWNTHRAVGGIESRIGSRNVYQIPLDGFKIPGVSEPPVLAFQILISMFLVIAGPVFFFAFKKRHSLHLLYFATPALSLAACLGMFLYAILNDGFAIRARSHSVTFLDQPTQNAVTQSRSAFYSGSRPNGYVFGENTLALDTRRENSLESQYDFRGDQLVLTGGEMKARMPHQITACEAFQTDLNLAIRQHSDGTFSVTNNLNSQVDFVAIRPDQGYEWSVASNIPVGSTVKCENRPVAVVAQRLRELARSRSPNTGITNRTTNWRNYNYYQPKNLDNGAADDFIELLRTGTVVNQNQRVDKGHYVAIVKKPVSSSEPESKAIYEQNPLHVIYGKW